MYIREDLLTTDGATIKPQKFNVKHWFPKFKENGCLGPSKF